MAEKLTHRVSGQKGADDGGAEFNSLSGGGDAAAEFIVVGQIVQQRFEAADGFEVAAAERQRGTQPEAQSLFQKPRAQNARHKVSADAQGFEARAQSRAGDTAVKTSHQSDGSVRERRDYLAQIIRRNPDIAVVHQQEFVARCRQHLRQIADFDIRSQNALANNQFNRKRGIFRLQLAHHIDGRIGGIADPEDQLKLRVVLFAMAAKTLPSLGIETFQRLENRNGRKLAFQRRNLAPPVASVPKKTGRREHGEKVKTDCRPSQSRPRLRAQLSW